MMAMAGAGLSIALPGLIRLPARLTEELWIGCGLYLLTFAFLPLISFRPLAEAEQRGYLVNLLLAAQLKGAAVAGVALAYAGWGLVGQFAALVVGGVIFHLGLAWDGVRRYPEVFARGQAIAGVGRSVWALSWPTLLFSLSGRLGLLTDNLVVAGLLGPTAVASFFLTQRLIAVAGTQVLAVGGATWAGLIDLHFRGERDVFVRRFAQLTRLTAALGAGLLLPVAVWNRNLIVLWVGSDQYAGAWVTCLAAANAWGQGLLSLWLWPMAPAGLVRATLPAVLCSTAVNLVVSLSATAAVGLPGPLIGTAVASAGVTRWWTLLILSPAPQRPTTALASGGGRAGAPGCPLWCRAGSSGQGVPAYGQDCPRWAGLRPWPGGWRQRQRILRPGLALAFPSADRAELSAGSAVGYAAGRMGECAACQPESFALFRRLAVSLSVQRLRSRYVKRILRRQSPGVRADRRGTRFLEE